MKLAILGPSKDYIGYSTKRLLEEGKKKFGQADLIPVIQTKLKIGGGIDVLHEKVSLKDYDYILPRIDSKRAEMGHLIMRFLDDMNVKKPYTADTVIIAHNKFLTLEQLARNNVPVPTTYLTASKSSAKEILKKHSLPVIIKLLSGFGGKGVMIMESREAAQSVIETMNTLKQEILIEEFIPNPGEDIRAIVAGDEIIGSFKRIAKKGEKRANIKIGGKGVTFKLTDDMEDIALRSAKSIKARTCAVDIINGDDGPKVIEVNINPGLQGIETTTNLNIAQRIMDFVENELKK